MEIYSGPSQATAMQYLKNSIATGRYIGLKMKQRGGTWRVTASGVRTKGNRSMKTPKLGKWIRAHRVRVVKQNGVKVLEIQRTVPKRKNSGASTKKAQYAAYLRSLPKSGYLAPYERAKLKKLGPLRKRKKS